jgi:hypothetical protein
MSIKKVMGIFSATALISLMSATTAFGHATVQNENAVADGYGYFAIRIPHGCEGKATDQVIFSIPAEVTGVKPERKFGWTIETKASEGNPTVVTYKTADGLPNDQFEDFGFSVKWPNSPNETIYFETTQKCGADLVSWNQIPAEGQDSHSLESPAPAVVLQAKSADSHGHGEEKIDAMSESHSQEQSSFPLAGIFAGVIAGIVSGIGSRFLFPNKK